MTLARRLASRLLHAVLRHSPYYSREWASAMLRELDFIESDWVAFFWALGSTTAIFKHSVRGWKAWFGRESSHKEEAMNNVGKKAVGIASGVGIAGMLVVCAFGLLLLANYLLPGLGLDRLEWTHWLTVIVIPELIFIVAVATMWQKRRPMAVGILLMAVVLATHAVVHIALHGGI
jgi:hypothetical protein